MNKASFSGFPTLPAISSLLSIVIVCSFPYRRKSYLLNGPGSFDQRVSWLPRVVLPIFVDTIHHTISHSHRLITATSRQLSLDTLRNIVNVEDFVLKKKQKSAGDRNGLCVH